MSAAVSLRGASFSLDGEPIRIRAMVPEDIPFIGKTWITSHKRNAHVSSDSVYFNGQRRLIDYLLNSSMTVVACPEDAENTIVGWASGKVYSHLHYAYVPQVFRGRGIARELITTILGVYPSRIEVSHSFNNKNAACRFVFNPYQLLVPSR